MIPHGIYVYTCKNIYFIRLSVDTNLVCFYIFKKNSIVILFFIYYGIQDLVPWPGIEPGPPSLEAQSLNVAPPGKSLLPYLGCCK